MSKSNIPDKVQKRLWAKTAGRCEFPGCNKILYRDELSKNEYNISYIGHIIADSPNGPRGNDILSPEKAIEYENLMLLCDQHHRLIDGDYRNKYSVEILQNYKKKHEDRIECLTGIKENMKTYIVLYGANIGMQGSSLCMDKALLAVAENGYYPASTEAIELSLKNSSFTDDNEEFWIIEKKNLEALYKQKLRFKLKDGNVPHLSIFGFAPQPLLIYLGYLLTDIPTAELYQLHRSPPNWNWKRKPLQQDYKYILTRDKQVCKDVALVISLSQKIEESKVKEILGPDVPIWGICLEEPHSEAIQTKGQLDDFRITYKKALSEIKYINSDKSRIHLFPAVPVSVAIEIGRARLSKADLPMTLYDYNNIREGFIRTFEIE